MSNLYISTYPASYRIDFCNALAREADLAILAEEDAAPLRLEGVFYTYWSFASTEFYKDA